MASFIAASAADESSNAHSLPKLSKRSSSSRSPTGGSGDATPKCICAPATHACSFKCRLHRTGSSGSHSHQSTGAPKQRANPAAATPSRTVEAL